MIMRFLNIILLGVNALLSNTANAQDVPDFVGVYGPPVPPRTEAQKKELIELEELVKTVTRSEPWPAEDFANHIPLSPDNYPESIKGIFWMDQSSSYGESTFVDHGYAPEGVLSWGDTRFATFDPETNSIYHANICSPAWSTDVSPPDLAGVAFSGDFHWKRVGECHANGSPSVLMFQWSDDFENCTLAFFQEGERSSGNVGNVIYEMYRQHAPEGMSCPPAEGATKAERNLCAEWIRYTYFEDGSSRFYPVFRVVDNDGNRVEPYFTAYLNSLKERNVTHQTNGVWPTDAPQDDETGAGNDIDTDLDDTDDNASESSRVQLKIWTAATCALAFAFSMVWN